MVIISFILLCIVVLAVVFVSAHFARHSDDEDADQPPAEGDRPASTV